MGGAAAACGDVSARTGEPTWCELRYETPQTGRCGWKAALNRTTTTVLTAHQLVATVHRFLCRTIYRQRQRPGPGCFGINLRGTGPAGAAGQQFRLPMKAMHRLSTTWIKTRPHRRLRRNAKPVPRLAAAAKPRAGLRSSFRRPGQPLKRGQFLPDNKEGKRSLQ